MDVPFPSWSFWIENLRNEDPFKFDTQATWYDNPPIMKFHLIIFVQWNLGMRCGCWSDSGGQREAGPWNSQVNIKYVAFPHSNWSSLVPFFHNEKIRSMLLCTRHWFCNIWSSGIEGLIWFDFTIDLFDLLIFLDLAEVPRKIWMLDVAQHREVKKSQNLAVLEVCRTS